jgi:hypothetical protein
MNFGTRNFTLKRNKKEKKKTLMFKEYNFTGPMEYGAVRF